MDIYLIDSQSIYTKTVAIDPMEALPGRCVLQSPPALAGSEVALWNGAEWDILPERPIPAPIDPAIALQARREAMVCTPWKIRDALDEKGWIELVETAVAASDGKTQRAWQFAQEFKRLDPLVLSIGLALSKTDAELDALFELAMGL